MYWQHFNFIIVPVFLTFPYISSSLQTKKKCCCSFFERVLQKPQTVDLVQLEMKITNIKRIWNLLDPIRKRFNWSFQLSIGEKWRNQNTRNILVNAETFAQIHFSWKRWSWMKGALKDGETPFHCFFFFQFSMRNFSCYFWKVTLADTK